MGPIREFMCLDEIVFHYSRILLPNHLALFGCLMVSKVIWRMCRLVPVVSGRVRMCSAPEVPMLQTLVVVVRPSPLE